jgi:ABC-type sugar transport system permease subunit
MGRSAVWCPRENSELAGNQRRVIEQPSGHQTDLLELLGKAAGLVAVLLPAAGVVVRYVAFRATGLPGDRLHLAWSASLSELIATGFLALLPVFLGLVFLRFTWRKTGPRIHMSQRLPALNATADRLLAEFEQWQIDFAAASTADDVDAMARLQERVTSLRQENDALQQDFKPVKDVFDVDDHSWLGRLADKVGWLPLIPLGAVVIVAMLFVPLILGLLLAWLIAASYAWSMTRAFRREPVVRLSHIWPTVVVVLIAAAVVSGLGGYLPGITPQDYSFDSTVVGLTRGRFQPVAQEDGLIYLESCQPAPRELVAVQQSAIVTVRPIPGSDDVNTGPSLWNVLFNGDHLSLGLRQC